MDNFAKVTDVSHLRHIDTQAQQCFKCSLHTPGKGVVFGCGPEDAELMIIGEAPGYNEDLDGIPFTGKAGKLLNIMLANGMGMKRDEVYLANILKCRPHENRDPTEEEMAACWPWLEQQITTIRPKVIMTVGKFGSVAVIKPLFSATMTNLRGRIFEVKVGDFNVSVVPTWHPAFLLRQPAYKIQAQEDMNKVLELLGRPW
jgi:DNA polymerase